MSKEIENASLSKKQNSVLLKSFKKHSNTSKIIQNTYWETLQEFFWLLRLDNSEKRKTKSEIKKLPGQRSSMVGEKGTVGCQQWGVFNL